MKTTLSLALGVACLLTACGEQISIKQPTLLGGKPLDSKYASPDGMTLGKDGYIYLSMNQKASNWSNPAMIMRIAPDDTLEEFFQLPVNSKTGVCAPLGLLFAADGNMYLSDNQSFATDEPNQAGIIRVVIENGKPVKGELVVTGFNMSNGITQWGNAIYVAETNLGVTGKHMSGVYRFTLDELSNGDTLRVKGVDDPHLVLSFETKSKEHLVGANGVAMDSKGNLYVNNFGDAEILKFTFDKAGKVVSNEVFCKPKGVVSLDGMQMDDQDVIWTADFVNNAIVKVDTKSGTSSIIAHNSGPTTGEKGELDAPSECIRRGDKVYVSNIDIDYGTQTADRIQTISVISLK